MLLKASVTVIGKDRQNYTDTYGTSKYLYVVNISQDNGKIVDTLHVSEEQFGMMEPGKECILEMVSKNGRNGLYLRTTTVYPVK